MDSQSIAEKLFAQLSQVLERLGSVENELDAVKVNLPIIPVDRKYYSTADLAAMFRVSKYTVANRWCAGGRIKCDKDPVTKRWRIPASEVRRLLREGPA